MGEQVDQGPEILDLALIRAAHERIRRRVHRTPVLTSESLDAQAGASLHFKCENLQKVGAFKARGAANAVFCLDEAQAARGVVTHSSGNHGAALSWAARLRGIPAYVVMPRNASRAKIDAVRRYGGEVVFCEPTLAAREAEAQRLRIATGAELVHPFDDLRVMAGQGTTAIELLEDRPQLDAILCPVGGGGQLSGVAAAAKALKPGIQVWGVEPAAVNDAWQSFKARRLLRPAGTHTVADGLRASLGEGNFAQILRHVDDIVTVSEEDIVQAMRQMWEVLKIVVEPSGAVAYAGIRAGCAPLRGAQIGVLVSGGNLDLDDLPW